MKISAFTIVRNAIKYNYPILESIQSILGLCDELIINVGDSTDGTLTLIKSIKSQKIKIIENKWDFSQGKEVLSYQTNLALKECKGDWAFYLQSDEVIHENDLLKLKKVMKESFKNNDIDALRFLWFHFYGSYYRYRIDLGWYQKQDRIIRNNGEIESYGDAFGFKRKDDKPLRRRHTYCFVYHYGWVQPEDVMQERRLNAEKIGFVQLTDKQRESKFKFTDLEQFPAYFGTHPRVMTQRIQKHALSQGDLKRIGNKYWWHPLKIFNVRFKTGRRVKEKIE